MVSGETSAKLGSREPRLPAEDRTLVEAAIADAESTTGAEFVVAIAARSGRYDRAEDLFGLCSGLVGVTAAWLVFQGVAPNPREWEAGWALTLGLPAVLGIFAAWAVLGAAVAGRFPWLAKPFMSRVQMEEDVLARGREAFHIFRVDGSPEAPGVLIYVSLLEHRVLIAAADVLGARLPAGSFDAARDALVADIRSDQAIGASLAGAVRRCASAIVDACPAAPNRANRIGNTVRVMW